jgi:hypothetical protein
MSGPARRRAEAESWRGHGTPLVPRLTAACRCRWSHTTPRTHAAEHQPHGPGAEVQAPSMLVVFIISPSSSTELGEMTPRLTVPATTVPTPGTWQGASATLDGECWCVMLLRNVPCWCLVNHSTLITAVTCLVSITSIIPITWKVSSITNSASSRCLSTQRCLRERQ